MGKIVISGKNGMKRKSHSNPVVAHMWKDIYEDCPKHDGCFDYAIDHGWHFWSCAECPLYKNKPKPAVNPSRGRQPKVGLWRRIASMLGK